MPYALVIADRSVVYDVVSSHNRSGNSLQLTISFTNMFLFEGHAEKWIYLIPNPTCIIFNFSNATSSFAGVSCTDGCRAAISSPNAYRRWAVGVSSVIVVSILTWF